MGPVFISYSHESEAHRVLVASFCERLRDDGFDAVLDQHVNGDPPEGWPRWMLNRLDEASFVVVVCTETYYRRFRGHEAPNRGRGVDWEGCYITQELYDARSRNLRFIPVYFDSRDATFVPEPLRGGTPLALTSEPAYQKLCDILSGAAGIEPGPVGSRTPRQRQGAPPPLRFRDSGDRDRVFGRGGGRQASASTANPSTHVSDFDAMIEKAAGQLLEELSWIDQEFQFLKQWFTPLNAEVDVHTGRGLDDRKIADLLASIESDEKSPLFLVLGEPGSGKSVAMRELARHGLRRVRKTRKLSIYINLREWLSEQKWTQDTPPDTRSLESFVTTYLASFDNAFLRDFFHDNFRRLRDEGRIFWIFDSFDEIPAVLDAGADDKWIVNELSEVLGRFVTQVSRGVISSRYSRKPELSAERAKRLDIRPFGEDKIREALELVKAFPQPLISTLLGSRPDLVPLARTPFFLGLIAEFGSSQRRLPDNQIELFETYLLSRMGSSSSQVDQRTSAAIAQAIYAAENISHFLQTSRFGLEAPRDALAAEFPDVDIPAIIKRLVEAKIMRTGRPPGYMSSFTHRRIQEYFVIRHMARTKAIFDHEWVALDTNMRDAAVLYVQLASDVEAQSIAERCWTEIENCPADRIDYADPAFWRALHCQRFLAEAFRSRLPALASFRDAMADRVYAPLAAAAEFERSQIEPGEAARKTARASLQSKNRPDLITLKLAVETLGLLPEDRIPNVLAAALQSGDPWIRESSVNASRFLPKVRPDLAGQIWRSIAAMPEEEFRKERTRLTYAFQLASGLSDIGVLIRRRIQDDRNWRWFGEWIACAVQFWRLIPIMIWREVLLRHPNDELRPLTTAQGEALAVLDRDKSAGLSGYRKVLAATKPWRLLSLGVVLAMAGVIWTQMIDVTGSSRFSQGYGFAAFIFTLERFSFAFATMGFFSASVWISPLFAQRNYRLIVPNEQVPKTNWRAYFKKWLGWAAMGLGILLACAISVGIFFAISWMFKFFPDQQTGETVKSYLFIGCFIVFILWIGAITVVTLFAFIKKLLQERYKMTEDRKQYRLFTCSDNSTREAIADRFSRFQTDKARQKYVRWLGMQGMRPKGEWPTGRPPNLGDDASSLLARLEHRWRGLDR